MIEICIITSEGHQVQRMPLIDGRAMRIGRAKDVELRLDDPMVSRHHAVIVPDAAGRWLIRDTGSTHGCYVDDERVEEAALEHGVEVRIGSAVLRVDDVASRVARELDRILDEDEERSGHVEVQIIGLDGRRSAHLDDTVMPGHHPGARPSRRGESPRRTHPKA